MLDWAEARGLGFSELVSLGNMTDVDFGDMLDYLANDPNTRAILLYIEAVTQTRKFMSAARAAACLKPLIAIKAGRHEEAARAAKSHTGPLAGRDEVYDAAFRRAGIVRAANLEDLFDAVAMLSHASALSFNNLIILTNGGGPGILATDALLDQGGQLTALSADTISRLNDVLPRSWSHANPVDIIGDATADRYTRALDVLLEAPEGEAILVINCPTAVEPGVDIARAVAWKADDAKKPVITNWLGAARARGARDVLNAASLPSYGTPEQAVRGFMHLVSHYEGQKTLLHAPGYESSEFACDAERARQILAARTKQTAGWLPPDLVTELLASYGIPVLRSAVACSPEEAGRHADEIGGLIALKIISPDVTHKADVGGVALNLKGEREVRNAAQAMRDRVAERNPSARIDGYLVQEIADPPDAYEVILGAVANPQFGPFLLFGTGGSAVEIIDDKSIALPPLNRELAHDMVSRTRIYKQLNGYRNRTAAALDELADTLVKLSRLICDLDEIAEFEINPLLVHTNGVIAVDARARRYLCWLQRIAARHSSLPSKPRKVWDIGGNGPLPDKTRATRRCLNDRQRYSEIGRRGHDVDCEIRAVAGQPSCANRL